MPRPEAALPDDSAQPDADPAPGPRLRLSVTSDLALVAGAVAAALADQGFEAWVSPWPGEPGEPGGTEESAAVDGTGPEHPQPDVALALCDLANPASLATVRELVTGRPPPWVVLTTTSPGPLWGAVLEAGADLVLSGDTSISETATAVVGVATGARPAVDLRPFRRAWEATRNERDSLSAVLEQLTPTEEAVLAGLYAGRSVREIAGDRGVAESTVRHQVGAILRKLQVGSQIAAVAIYARALEYRAATRPTMRP